MVIQSEIENTIDSANVLRERIEQLQTRSLILFKDEPVVAEAFQQALNHLDDCITELIASGELVCQL